MGLALELVKEAGTAEIWERRIAKHSDQMAHAEKRVGELGSMLNKNNPHRQGYIEKFEAMRDKASRGLEKSKQGRNASKDKTAKRDKLEDLKSKIKKGVGAGTAVTAVGYGGHKIFGEKKDEK